VQAYEFYAVPKNGIIPIPEPYKSKITSRIKVILLEQTPSVSDSGEATERKRTDCLSPVAIDTRGWTFDKEEANER
jgi:hypothetical protein